MAGSDQGKGGGHCGSGHAPAGHSPGEGSDGHIFERHRFANSVLCGGKRAGQHPAAAGGGHCRRKGQGRPLRPNAEAPAGELPRSLPALEKGGRGTHMLWKNQVYNFSPPY